MCTETTSPETVPVHELRILRSCQFLQNKSALKKVIDALPKDVAICGFLDFYPDPQMKINFTAPSLGILPKKFAVKETVELVQIFDGSKI